MNVLAQNTHRTVTRNAPPAAFCSAVIADAAQAAIDSTVIPDAAQAATRNPVFRDAGARSKKPDSGFCATRGPGMTALAPRAISNRLFDHGPFAPSANAKWHRRGAA
jgi:hypothetical protein